MHHKRHPDFVVFDKVTIEVAERWKESYLSGDEWRFSAIVKLYFKGIVIATELYGSMDQAMMRLQALYSDNGSPVSDTWLNIERQTCDQPGCAELAKYRHTIRHEYSRSGDKLVVEPSRSFRKFCERHKRRGDCGLEDADENYEVIPL
jgi:hypothetical protein